MIPKLVGVFRGIAAQFESWISGAADGDRTVMTEAAGSFGARATGLLLAFIAQIALTRYLGAESYGKYVYVLTWIEIAALIGAFGSPTSSVKYVAQYIAQHDWKLLEGYLRFSRLFVAASSVMVATVLAVVTLSVDAVDGELITTFIMGCLLLPPMSLLDVAAAELRGLRFVVRSQMIRLTLPPFVIATAVLILAMKVTSGAPVAMTVNIAAVTLALIVTFGMVHIARKRRTEAGNVLFRSREWFSTAKDMLLIAGFSLALFKTDTVMIGVLRNTTEAGYYSVAARLAAILVVVLGATNAVLGPRMSELFTRGEKGRLACAYEDGSQNRFGASLFLTVVLLLGDDPLLGLFGPEFRVDQDRSGFSWRVS